MTADAQILRPREPQWTDQWLFSISGMGGLPLGEFRQHEDGGIGLDGMVGWQPFRRQPLILRATMASLLYDAVRARGFQDVCDDFGCRTEEVTYNAREHSMWMVQGGPEFMATDGTWRPFAFATLGLTFFTSHANFKPHTPSGPPETSESIFSSRNFATAYGGGLRRVTTRFGRERGLELSARVTRNARATYLNERGLVQRSDGTWDIAPRTGTANVLGIYIGFWMGPYINWNERR